MTTGRPHELDAALYAHAAAHPDRIALDAGDASLSYAALTARVCKLSGWLRRLGARGVLAVRADDPAQAIPALLACMDAGWTYAPIDPSWPAQRLQVTLEILRPDAMLELDAKNPQAIDTKIKNTIKTGAIDALPDAAPARAEAAGAANVFFTSGTTGAPKGILGRPGAATRFVAWEADMLGLGDGLRVSALAPTTFDASLRDALLPLHTGGTICAPPDRGVFADGARLVAWLAEARVQVVHTVPTVWRGLLQAMTAGALPELRAALLAGEALRPSDVARTLEVFDQGSFALFNMYGPTETTMVRLCHRVRPEDAQGSSVPLGLPIADTEVFIVDSAGMRRGVGKPGEIVIRTPFAALGYLGRPEETARAFVPDLLGDGDPTPVYRTGDVGVLLASGEVAFRGRRDHQVKLRGVRVELEGVEAALSAVAGVEAAAAALREGPRGEPALMAWIVGEASPAVVHEAVRQVLPGAAVPERIIALDALPRLLNGKIDRASLKAPDTIRSAGVPPSGMTERTIAQTLQEVLGGEVGATDDVFELGCSSLQALQVVWRLNEALSVELPVDLLYKARTVQAIAARVDETRRAAKGHDAALWSLEVLHEGLAPPTIWLPPAYGLSVIYHELLDRMDSPAQAIALDLRAPSGLSVEALAAQAIDAIRQAQPRGPYRLAGWSFGGVLAFEIARQLGPEQVERLVLLDSAAPGDGFRFEAGDAEAAALAARRIGHMLGMPIELDADADSIKDLDALALCDVLLDKIEALGLPVGESSRAQARTIVAVREASLRAWRAYRPAPLDAPNTHVWLARAEDAPADWTLGWDALIPHNLTRRTVGGTHVGMMDEPHLSALAALLRDVLG